MWLLGQGAARLGMFHSCFPQSCRLRRGAFAGWR
jgi:hypothetical protein